MGTDHQSVQSVAGKV